MPFSDGSGFGDGEAGNGDGANDSPARGMSEIYRYPCSGPTQQHGCGSMGLLDGNGIASNSILTETDKIMGLDLMVALAIRY